MVGVLGPEKTSILDESFESFIIQENQVPINIYKVTHIVNSVTVYVSKGKSGRKFRF